MSRYSLIFTALLFFVLATSLTAQTPDSTLLTLDRIYASGEFRGGRGIGPITVDRRGAGVHDARAVGREKRT